jgi:hypothetical protein
MAAQLGVISTQFWTAGMLERCHSFPKTRRITTLCGHQAAQKMRFGDDLGLRRGSAGEDLLAEAPGSWPLPRAV